MLAILLASTIAHATRTTEFNFDLGLRASNFGFAALPSLNNVTLIPGLGGRPFSACLTLKPGEIAIGAGRAELTDKYRPALHHEIVYRFSTYIPETFPIDDGNSTIIAQWHASGPFKPSVAFRFRQGRLDITLDRYNRGTSDPLSSGQKFLGMVRDFKRGVWHESQIKAVWSTESDGSLEIEVDGQQVVQYRGPLLYPGQRTGPYFKYGIYVARPITQRYEVCQGPYVRIE